MFDSFVTDSVNGMKIWPLVAKKLKKISVYINLAQPHHQKSMEIITRNNNAQNIRKPNWLDRNW